MDLISLPEFVEDSEVQSGQMLGDPALSPGSGLDFQTIDEVDHVVEASASSGSDAASRNSDGQVGLAGAGAADQDGIALLGGEAVSLLIVRLADTSKD